jgi:cytidylate kinase
MIDEYPILAIAAAFAEGVTRMEGLAELRVKESNRLEKIQAGLTACGIRAEVEGDTLIVHGIGQQQASGGCIIDSALDHRIAMSFLVMGLRCKDPVYVKGTEAIATSFPNFFEVMETLGVQRKAASEAAPSLLTHPIVIAIDGPAASGKGTLARRLAATLGLVYLDTGSLYRAVGMKLVYNQQDPRDIQAAIEAAQHMDIQDLQNPRLRQERIGQAASVVSAIPEVRQILLDFQRKIAASPQGAVLDGRDIGTVICPDADVKIFITASIETRARRRHREVQGEGITVVYESVLEDLMERDERDSKRSVAPLIPAEDAHCIDTSDMTAEEVYQQVLQIIRDYQASHQNLKQIA